MQVKRPFRLFIPLLLFLELLKNLAEIKTTIHDLISIHIKFQHAFVSFCFLSLGA